MKDPFEFELDRDERLYGPFPKGGEFFGLLLNNEVTAERALQIIRMVEELDYIASDFEEWRNQQVFGLFEVPDGEHVLGHLKPYWQARLTNDAAKMKELSRDLTRPQWLRDMAEAMAPEGAPFTDHERAMSAALIHEIDAVGAIWSWLAESRGISVDECKGLATRASDRSMTVDDLWVRMTLIVEDLQRLLPGDDSVVKELQMLAADRQLPSEQTLASLLAEVRACGLSGWRPLHSFIGVIGELATP